MAELQPRFSVDSVESIELADSGLVLVTVNARIFGRPPISPRLLIATDDPSVPVRLAPTDVRTGEPAPDGSSAWTTVFSLARRLNPATTALTLDLGYETVALPMPQPVGAQRAPVPRPEPARRGRRVKRAREAAPQRPAPSSDGAGSRDVAASAPRGGRDRATPRRSDPPPTLTGAAEPFDPAREREALAKALTEADERLAGVQSTLAQARDAGGGTRRRASRPRSADAPAEKGASKRPAAQPRAAAPAPAPVNPGGDLEDVDRRLGDARSAVSGARKEAEGKLESLSNWSDTLYEQRRAEAEREAKALIEAERGLNESKRAIDEARKAVARERMAGEQRLEERLGKARETWGRQLDAAETRSRELEREIEGARKEAESAKSSLAEIQGGSGATLERLRSEHAAALERASGKHAQELERLRAEREREREEHRADGERLRAELAKSLDDLRGELDRTRAAEEGKLRVLEKAVAEERERAATESTARARADAERLTAATQTERARAEATAQREELDRVRREAERDRTRMHTDLAEAERARTATRTEVERLQAELEADRLEHARAQATWERRVADAESEVARGAALAGAGLSQEQETQLRQSYEQRLTAAETQLQDAVSARNHAETRIAELQGQLDSTRQGSDEVVKHLEMQLEAERSSRQEAQEMVDRERERGAGELRKVRSASAERERALEEQLAQRGDLEERISHVTAELHTQLERVGGEIEQRDAALKKVRDELATEKDRNAKAQASARASDRESQEAMAQMAERVGRTTGELREQLQEATARLEGVMVAERQGRQQAEEALAKLRERSAADRAAARRATGRAHRLERELRELQEGEETVAGPTLTPGEPTKPATGGEPTKPAPSWREPQAGAAEAAERTATETAKPDTPGLGVPEPEETEAQQPEVEAPQAQAPEFEAPGASAPDATESHDGAIEPADETRRPRLADEPPPTVGPVDVVAAADAAKLAGPPPGSGTATRDWLLTALPKLAREDGVAAGQLLVAMLPGQGLIAREPVEYDLQLAEVGQFAVSVRPGRAEVNALRAARRAEEVEFTVEANALGLAQLVSGARTSRLRRGGRLRVRGRDRREASLPELAAHAIGLPELVALGVRINPLLVYQALRWAVEPSWTRGHYFSVAHEVTGERGEVCYITAADGRRLVVSISAPAAVSATIRTPEDDFLSLVAGLPARVEVRGEERHAAELQSWIARVHGHLPVEA